MRKPYFVKRLMCWYVKDANSKEIRLDPDKKKAFELWHELQAASCFKGKDATVGGLLAAFLGELEGTLSKDRFEALKYYARLFIKDYKTELITEIML